MSVYVCVCGCGCGEEGTHVGHDLTDLSPFSQPPPADNLLQALELLYGLEGVWVCVSDCVYVCV